MRRTGRKYQPHLPPVQKVELPEKYSKWRWVLLVVLLVGGLALISVAAVKFLTKSPGWQSITADGGTVDNCSGDFSLQYLLGETEQPANLENNSVTEVYTKACGDAYKLFNSQESFPDVQNLHYVSTHAGEAIQVDPALYHALSLMDQAGSRALYLAPVYEVYRTLFASPDDEAAAENDPMKDDATRAYIRQTVVFTNDPQHISLELLSKNQVRLAVSREYREFAAANGITVYLDFGWMRNAFIADMIADRLIEAGHTNGVLSSYDGFTRVLKAEDSFSINLFDRAEEGVYGAAVMEYSNVKSMITLRNYPTNELNQYLYYVWDDATIYHGFADPADGLCKTSVNDLVVWSRSLSCAETVLFAAPVYVAEALDTAALQVLPSQNVEYAVFVDRILYASDAQVTFTNFFNRDGIVYKRGEWPADEA